MKTHRFTVGLLALVTTTATACTLAGRADAPPGTTSSALDVGNGREMNGREMNGREMNGREMNGTSLATGPGVWYALYSGATYDMPFVMKAAVAVGSSGALTLSPALAPAPVGATPLLGSVLGGGVIAHRTVSITSIARPSAPSGELIATFVDNGVTGILRGAAFKNVTLMGKGPTPYLPPLVVNIGLAGAGVQASTSLAGGTTGTGTATTAGTPVNLGTIGTINLPPIQVFLPPPSPADIVNAYVKRVRTLTDRPVRDVPLRIVDAVASAPADMFHMGIEASLWHYKVQVQNGSGWEDFCADGRYAVALPDTWSYVQGFAGDGSKPAGGSLVPSTSAFTFACDGSALTKCTERLGYTPWGSAHIGTNNDQSTEPLLETCVRMIRADYCGNGISMTRNGTTIDVSDSASVNAPSESSWLTEARWTNRGATCGEATRQISVPEDGSSAYVSVKDYVSTICPGAFTTSPDPAFCGSATSGQIPGGSGGPPPGGGGQTLSVPALGGPIQSGTIGKPSWDYSLIYTKTPLPAAPTDVGLTLAPLPQVAIP